MRISTALKTIGGLSNPSKMPCYGHSTPSPACPLGSLLARVEGSVCFECYADPNAGGTYAYPVVKAALARRLDIVRKCEHDPIAREEWISAFAFILNYRRDRWTPESSIDHRYFRWHDSGDLQGLYHLGMISEVASRTFGRVEHWLPTRELPTVNRFVRAFGMPPSNLIIRISANKVDAPLPRVKGFTASGVHTVKGRPSSGALECPAIYNEGSCGDCRNCWNPSIPEVSYLKH